MIMAATSVVFQFQSAITYLFMLLCNHFLVMPGSHAINRRINNTKNDYYYYNDGKKDAVTRKAEEWHSQYEEHYKNKTLPSEWALYSRVAKQGVAAIITDRK